MWWLLANEGLKIGRKVYKNRQAKKNGFVPDPADVPGMVAQKPPAKASFKAYVELILYFLELVFGLTVIGLYGRDVHAARKHGDPQNAKWVYALVVGSLGASTGLVYLGYGMIMAKLGRLARERKVVVSMVKLGWGGVLVILWMVVFGVFGGLYIGVYGEGKDQDVGKTTRMRHAVWVDLVNLVFWIGTTVVEGLRFWRLRGGRERGKDQEMFDTKDPEAAQKNPPPGY
ncbi:hypothetical protein BDV28DRAFT_163830 [Aspergillus coremiiformis]|uniref:MARVEL domain-containing protein n=1 Tax=Aspergillus coremiiformis TaxID=138285 RepID=A0A5N6YVL5_9EURO|nr:hypothetical protein BDV28DRAFT_163830 [Aspergillus coremiiformis]